jgi:hypothetical protein
LQIWNRARAAASVAGNHKSQSQSPFLIASTGS